MKRQALLAGIDFDQGEVKVRDVKLAWVKETKTKNNNRTSA
jgi:hypothetical protein